MTYFGPILSAFWESFLINYGRRILRYDLVIAITNVLHGNDPHNIIYGGAYIWKCLGPILPIWVPANSKI